MQGKKIRLSKIMDKDKRAMLVAADHGLMLGPIKGVINLEETLKKIIYGGVDGILISPGQAQHISHLFHGREAPAMLLRGDYTSGFRSLTYTLPNEQIHEFKIMSPKDALALGADAMVVYYLLGRPEDPLNDEATNIEIIAKMAEESEKCGLPFFIEPMPFGPRVTGSNYIDLLRIGIRVSEEIGADAIKIPYSGDIDSFRKIVDSVNIPIFILGGAKSKTYREACEMVEDALTAGANGTVFGRQILQAPDPQKLAGYLMKIIHKGIKCKDIFAEKIKSPSRLEINLDKCTGCNICSIACSMAHSGMNDPNYYAIHVEHSFPKKLRPQVCIQCGKCIEICPNSAIKIDPTDHHLMINPELCDLCGNSEDASKFKCVLTCPKKVIKPPLGVKKNQYYNNRIPLICDFCGGCPECIEWCPNEAIDIKESRFNNG
ncbi:MAG: 4Fe-4S dicluster domain-containing protein [Candidatus Lokiarchaeota archaeon]|nr:4Fe-4S dicluster domain-containing protein [Candidatus Lokiarchaeota archaeon]